MAMQPQAVRDLLAMRGRRRRRARRELTAVFVAAVLAAACRGPRSPAAETARAWGDGPARWLLLPDEQSTLRQVRSNGDLTRFLAAFWACRDEDPARDDNAFARLFAQRVEAADRL